MARRWLIERGLNGPSLVRFMRLVPAAGDRSLWTHDKAKATSFTSKAEAEAEMARFGRPAPGGSAAIGPASLGASPW